MMLLMHTTQVPTWKLFVSNNAKWLLTFFAEGAMLDDRYMKYVMLFCLSVVLTSPIRSQDLIEVSSESLPSHPRILLLQDEEKMIRSAITANKVWSHMHDAIVQESEKMLELPALQRVQIGRRLLDKSRECLRRVFYLSYAYRMTSEKKYLDRAEKEMLTVAKFTDWNPDHFLDVAEMTMGMAIGYDWLFNVLSEESKKAIGDAIVFKGLLPSFDKRYNSWQHSTHNWNQVCNAGMVYGALAVAERYPGITQQVFDRAFNTIHLPMEEYQPDGAYPEGYMYWDYGTSFNVMLLSAADKAFGTDYGLTKTAGFLQTSRFYQNMTGVTGMPFNWGDCGPDASLSPSMFWFAQKLDDPSLLWVEKSYLQTDDFSRFTHDRLLPAIMIWAKDTSLDKITPPTALTWTGQGANPVYMTRTSWTNPNALYLGFKAGSASVNHGHMDVGSFVFEADGVRWAEDFGMQNYESLESKGIALFGRTQDAQRWTVFRLNNFVHNTVTVNNQYQLVNGYAKINRSSDKEDFLFATSDLSTVYKDRLAGIRRGVAIVDQKYLVVRDELTARDTTTTVRWTMLTAADVTISGNRATLKKDGKELLLSVTSPAKVKLKTWSTAPATDYDAPNPGTTLVGFEVQVPPGTSQVLQVTLIPSSAGKNVKKKIQPLDKW
jgi:hypothetical protein